MLKLSLKPGAYLLQAENSARGFVPEPRLVPPLVQLPSELSLHKFEKNPQAFHQDIGQAAPGWSSLR